jgi:hypothetical protein
MTRFRLIRTMKSPQFSDVSKLSTVLPPPWGVCLTWRSYMRFFAAEQGMKDYGGIDYPLCPLRYSDETPSA